MINDLFFYNITNIPPITLLFIYVRFDDIKIWINIYRMPPLVIGRNNITIGGKIIETSKSIGLTPKVEAIPALMTEERMYPPVRDINSTNHSITGQAYGNGFYVSSFSSSHSSFPPFRCFNTSDSTGGHWSNTYIQPNGTFSSSLTDNIVSGYNGDWLKIKFPVAINLTRYAFLQRFGNDGLKSRAPQNFKIYGSNDEINWIELTHGTNPIYVSGLYETTISTSGTYNSFGLVVNKLLGNSSGANVLNFDEWFIYGMEKLDPNNYSIVPFHEPINDDYKYIPFVNTGANQTSYTITFSEDTECDILVVGGGGAGGTNAGGGGGAGGLVYGSGLILNGTYNIEVGKGALQTANPDNGVNSTINIGGVSIIGAGGGGGVDGVNNGHNGGSGGGGASNSQDNIDRNGGVSIQVTSYTGTHNSVSYTFTGFGNNGGRGRNNESGGWDRAGGGGGGAGAVGNTSGDYISDTNQATRISHGGDGGEGKQYNITGTNTFYAGGGGGGIHNNTNTGSPGSGGSGIGGTGGNPYNNGGNGTANTGSGGGAGGGGGNIGGNGGSGIVIIRYKIIKIPFDAQWTYNSTNPSVYHLGNVGIGTINPTSALDVLGSVIVNGGISTNSYIASTKTFKIEHPLNINKWLYHGCIEAPRFDNIYRGKKMVINGSCEVDIDSECNTTGGMTTGTFMALNNNFSLHLQNKNSFDGVKGEIIDGKIIISCENIADEIEVEWLVIGERHDDGIVRNKLTNGEGMLICEHELTF